MRDAMQQWRIRRGGGVVVLAPAGKGQGWGALLDQEEDVVMVTNRRRRPVAYVSGCRVKVF